jgi:hypothetical protein
MAAASRGGGMGLFFFLALLVFLMSLLAAGGVFGYEQLLNKRIVDKDDSLRKAEGAFSAGTIQDLVRMDNRLVQAKTLLQKHISPSALFYFLSTITLERVQLTGMDMTMQPDGSASITLSGIADSFSSVALQSDQFGASKALRDVVVSGVSVAESGRVTFAVNATVDPALVSYAQNLQTAQTETPTP